MKHQSFIKLNFLVIVIALLMIVLPLVTSCKEQQEVVVWPEVTNEMKPWTRWWWMGSAVDEKNLSVLLEDFASKGIGGVEIAPIYGAKGYEEQYVSYLSPRWMELLDFTIQKAGEVGMGVDITTGTGWPFGGPEITTVHSANQLWLRKYELSPGERIDGIIEPENPRQRRVVHEVQAVTAYSEDGEKLNLLDKLTDGRMLDWSPEAGKWTVIVAFNGRTMQAVKRAAPGGEGLTFDHLSKEGLDFYLSKFDGVFGNSAHGLRSFFNDSYEVFGASWSTGLFDEFEKRRGYDLRLYIRELADEGDPDVIARVKSDYRETMSDMLIENFSERWTRWANAKGAKTRNQSHGSPANLLDVYASVDIPEIETFGGTVFPIPGLEFDMEHINQADHDLMFLKFASSAANVSGKKLVSCETFTWLNEHFRAPWAQCKAEAEQVFLAGVNHIFFHGTTYSPQDAAWPGWLFYASVNFNPSNSAWTHLSGLNEYITRCQSILQSGSAYNDLLVYWPVYDVWNDSEGLLSMMSVHGAKNWLRVEKVRDLYDEGYSFDFISDALLQTLNTRRNQMQTADRKNNYKALVLPRTTYIPVETLKKVLQIAEAGVPVVMQNKPADVPGLANLDDRRLQLEALWKGYTTADLGNGITRMSKGKANILISEDLAAAVALTDVRHEPVAELGLKYLRRQSEQGIYYYLVNHTPNNIDTNVKLNTVAQSAVFIDPLSGEYGVIPVIAGDGTTEVRIQSRPGESFFILLTDADVSGLPQYQYFEAGGSPFVVDGNWQLEFVEGGPVLPETVVMEGLKPWTELEDPDAHRFSGLARYCIIFDFVPEEGKSYRLDLGKVHESARVFMNSTEVDILWSIPYTVDVTDFLVNGQNTLEVEVANLQANRIIDMDRRGIEWQLFHEINFVNIRYRKFNAADWEFLPSGLQGPVTITPMETSASARDVALFNFGGVSSPDGYITVKPEDVYSGAGYGFEFVSNVQSFSGKNSNPLLKNGCSSESYFFFQLTCPKAITM